MNVIIHTLGCKVNQYESQAILEMFLEAGYSNRDDMDADTVIINSCTVTAESDKKTRQTLRKYRRKYKNATLVLCGCMPQAFPEKAKELDDADIIVGNTSPDEIINLVKKFKENGVKIFSVEPHKRNEKYNTPCISRFNERTRAFMKIEDGCDRYCTYCIIPYSRGVIRSRSLEDIYSEAVSLADKGYVEIVLVGINLTSYGKDEGLNICDAVDTVAKADGIKRIRLGSLEPDIITDEMLERLRKQEKFCPQFHLALQSGCDKTLKRMNRHYDTEFYFDLVKRIRKNFPECSFTTDIMVGFAGETENEFKESLEFVKKVGFARSHVFEYSRRTGTFAAEYKNQVSEHEKETRSKIMIETAKTCEKEFLKKLYGKVYSVLFESFDGEYCFGYTENYSRVKVKTSDDICGKILNVKITQCYDDHCIGEITA